MAPRSLAETLFRGEGTPAVGERPKNWAQSFKPGRTYAQSLGRNEFADLLQRTLDEEGEADKKLTQIAERKVNPQAAHH